MKTLEIIVGTVLVLLAIWIAIGARGEYDANFTDFSKSEEWITYTNTNYGYEISYPESVEFLKSSELGRPKAKKGKEDQAVLIGDYSDRVIYNMTAGASVDYTADTISELREKYISENISQFVSGRSSTGLNLKESDFIINEIEFNGRPAIEVLSPLSYKILMSNSEGNVFFVLANDYTGATTTSKDRNTRAIMETFRVLD